MENHGNISCVEGCVRPIFLGGVTQTNIFEMREPRSLAQDFVGKFVSWGRKSRFYPSTTQQTLTHYSLSPLWENGRTHVNGTCVKTYYTH